MREAERREQAAIEYAKKLMISISKLCKQLAHQKDETNVTSRESA